MGGCSDTQRGWGDGGKADPLLPMTVNGLTLPFLVDTGATYSTICEAPGEAQLSGDEVTLLVTTPLKTEIVKVVTHPYVISAQVPVDMCGADGLTVTL